MQVVDGGSGHFPAVTCVTDPATDALGDAPIAVQCCDLVSGDCRRHTAGAAATDAEMQRACVGGWGYENATSQVEAPHPNPNPNPNSNPNTNPNPNPNRNRVQAAFAAAGTFDEVAGRIA